MLEAKDQGASVPKKTQKRSSKFFFRQSQKEENKKGLRKLSATFLAFSKEISTVQKIGNFWGLEVSRPRTSKCVLEDSTSANYFTKPILHSLRNSSLSYPALLFHIPPLDGEVHFKTFTYYIPRVSSIFFWNKTPQKRFTRFGFQPSNAWWRYWISFKQFDFNAYYLLLVCGW